MTASQIVPTAANIGTATALTTTGLVSGAIAGPIGIAAGLLAAELMNVFSGCGQACIDASKALQVYEVAANDIINVAQAGLISGAQAQNLVQQVINLGLQNLQSLAQQDSKAQNGVTILSQQASTYLQQAGSFGNASQPFTLAKAMAVFMNPNTSGWYSDSVSAGNSLATQLLASLSSSSSASSSFEEFVRANWVWLLAGIGVVLVLA
jgi:hypothetical protein